MKSKPTRSKQDTTCMKCKRIIPKGMTYRQVFDGEKHVGDICYTVCKPGEQERTVDLDKEPLVSLLEMACSPLSTDAARSMAFHAVESRVDAIKKKLEEISADERLGYPTATIRENAPLALEQLALETWQGALRWVLRTLKDGE